MVIMVLIAIVIVMMVKIVMAGMFKMRVAEGYTVQAICFIP
jgi:hypothetical protein